MYCCPRGFILGCHCEHCREQMWLFVDPLQDILAPEYVRVSYWEVWVVFLVVAEVS